MKQGDYWVAKRKNPGGAESRASPAKRNQVEVIPTLLLSDIYQTVKKAMSDSKNKKSKKNPTLAIVGLGANPMTKSKVKAKKRNVAKSFIKAKPKQRNLMAARPQSKVRLNMAKQGKGKKKKHNPQHSTGIQRARSVGGKALAKGHTKRNPSVFKSVLGPTNWQSVAWGLTGGFFGSKLTRGLPELVLKDKNTGMVGNLANILTGALVTGLFWRVNANFGLGAGIGSFASWTDRIFQDVWAIGAPYIGLTAGLGDRMFAGLADYVNRRERIETWAPGMMPAGSAVSGLAEGASHRNRFARYN